MSHRFLAACLWVMAVIMLAVTAWIARVTGRRDRAAAITALVAAAAFTAILATAGADLWGMP